MPHNSPQHHGQPRAALIHRTGAVVWPAFTAAIVLHAVVQLRMLNDDRTWSLLVVALDVILLVLVGSAWRVRPAGNRRDQHAGAYHPRHKVSRARPADPAPEATAPPEPAAPPEATAPAEPTVVPELSAPPEPTSPPEPTAAPETGASSEPAAASDAWGPGWVRRSI